MNNVDNNKNKKRNVPDLTDKGTGVQNVPKLRFPEFQGEWEKHKLGDISEFSKERINTRNLTYDDYIATENMLQDYQGIVNASNIPSDTNVIKFNKGDILLSNIRPYLKKVWFADRNGGCSADVFVFKAMPKCNPDFLHHIIANDRFINFAMSGAKGVKMPRGDKEQMKTYAIGLPSIEEQEKIAKLLSLLDERIATQIALIDRLQSLMKGIGDELFCSPKQPNPRLSPDGFADEYRNFHLKDFAYRINRKNKDNACSLVLTIAAQYGLVNQEKFFNKSIASANLKGYYLLHKGEFAYNKSYSTGYPWGAVKRLNAYEEGLLSPLYICFSVNGDIVDPDYLSFYFETCKWHKGIGDIAVEGARNHGLLNVSIDDYFNTIHRLPSLKTQKKIAMILTSFQKKNIIATNELRMLKKQKEYLLRQMFI